MRISILLGLLLFAFTSASYGQNCITGNVYDAKTHNPMSGVTVRVVGTNQGGITDSNGGFRLCNLPKQPILLRVSHVGYLSNTIRIVDLNEDLKIFLLESSIAIEPIVVTATLTPQSTWEVPSMVSVIDSVKLISQSALNTDNYLRTIPGLFIDRSKGVFSKNASVTMRGLDGSNRVLILYDGAPLNKTSYGFINWSLISPDVVEQIEVVHGPSSALFGNNAMAGVINIRTKEPINSPFYGSVTGEAAGFGLFGARATLGGSIPITKRGVKIMVNGFWRHGDGYIADPPTIRDSLSSKLYLTEKGIVVKTLIPISDSSTFYLGGNLYEDKRGAGRGVYLKDGSFDAYTTQRVRFGYNGTIGKTKFEVYSYAQLENYYSQSENINKTGDYKLSHTFQESGDIGLWTNASRNIGLQNEVTVGIDLKHGWMDAEDIYRTSTDDIIRKGKVTFAAAFLQDEQSFFDSKVEVLGGVRIDGASFNDGMLKVIDPTSKTGFLKDTTANFPTSSWVSINPKFGVRYFPTSWLSFYGSIASGFMPAKLDDLCSSRSVTKGFKLANPNLQPEHLVTYEVGGGIKIRNILRFDIAMFLSTGYDFQYFVSTGDSIDVGGTLKPFLKRENITSVRILGGEANLGLFPVKGLTFNGNISFNKSEITSYKANPIVNIDLKGMALAEVPVFQASAEIIHQNRFVNVGLVWAYVGKQWGDEVNSYKIDSWNTFNLRIWREYRAIRVILDIQDLLDNPYIDKKGQISPGRFVQLSVTYSFK